jgi:hypothetical protein
MIFRLPERQRFQNQKGPTTTRRRGRRSRASAFTGRKRVADALERGVDVFRSCDITVGKIAEVELHGQRQAPLQRALLYSITGLIGWGIGWNIVLQGYVKYRSVFRALALRCCGFFSDEIDTIKLA